MTSIIPLGSTQAAMSSREISELTGKEHKTVLRDIRSMLITLYGEDHLDQIIPEQYRNRHSEYIREHSAEILNALFDDGTNRFHQEKRGFSWERDTRGYISLFSLDKSHTLTLVSGYNVALRKRIVDRWQELESAPSGTFDLAAMTSAALRELAAKVEEAATLKAAVITMQPKADFYDHVAGSEALFDRSDAAKLLRTGPKRLWASLRDWKVVQASGTPYQKYYDLGYFRLVPVLVHKGEYSIPYQQTMVTGKGLAWLKALMDSQVMPSKAMIVGEVQP